MTTPAARPGGAPSSPGMRCAVALCTYNGALHLPEQLESLIRQTRLPDELVVSDDASSDATWEIVQRFAERAPFPVRASRQDTNVGLARNFDAAIRRCDADWIALADQDDVWYPDKLQVLERALAADPRVRAVFTDAEVVQENLEALGYSLWDAVGFDGAKRRRARRGRLLEVLLWRNVFTGATLAFRAELRGVALPIPDEWYHDGWIGIVAAATGPVALLERPTIRYRQHAGNLVGATRHAFDERVKQVMGTPASDLWRQHRALGVLRDRLGQPGDGPGRGDALRALAPKLAHLEARARLAAPRWRRVRVVARELASGRYHRYSSGWLSAVKDLVQSADQRGDTTRPKV